MWPLVAVTLLLTLSAASGAVYFKEQFDDDGSWSTRWHKSTWKVDSGEAGDFTLSAGRFGDDKGVQTGPDARFFAYYSEFKPFSNEGKDLVVQFSVKHEQKLDCGGGYIKLLPSGGDMKNFGGDTPYALMFGPDICGHTKRVHNIITYKGKNLLTKKHIECETDQLTHVYTLILSANNTYRVLIDNSERASGALEDHWDFLEPKTIKDPAAVKPSEAEWDQRSRIPDPEAVKPADWVDGPKRIVDDAASKPSDWDDADDGEWEPPMIDNPAYKGEWQAPMITNPAYKGIWEAPDIPNPDYVPNAELYLLKDLQYVGFELWQVKSGTVFDSIIITDDAAEAAAFAEATWGVSRAAEKAAFDADAEATAAKEEAERKAAADAAAVAAPAAEGGGDEPGEGDAPAAAPAEPEKADDDDEDEDEDGGDGDDDKDEL